MAAASCRFGPFLVDRTAYGVLRGAEPLDLTPKLLDLLFHLVDHPGTLITKEELLEALWPDANVTENALAQAMSELRQALGDAAVAPQFIKTALPAPASSSASPTCSRGRTTATRPGYGRSRSPSGS
jgi:DNA-binding winged helix-turn-helix (wHTH) protein